jgi:hypothetical protein
MVTPEVMGLSQRIRRLVVHMAITLAALGDPRFSIPDRLVQAKNARPTTNTPR